MKRILITLLLIGLTTTVFAKNQDISVHLQLMRLKAVKMAEKNGDELYMTVAVYPSKGDASHFAVPKQPLFWPSRYLDKINNLKIWDGKLKNNEAVTLILSLMEQDTPPWNTDDLIGSVRVRLHNKKGKLEQTWGMPNRADVPVSVMTKYGQAKQFELLGEGSNYQMFLLLKKQ